MVGAAVPGALFPGQLSSLFAVGLTVSDTLVTMSDSIALPRRPQLADTLVTPSDTIAPSRLRRRNLTDTAVTISDAVDLTGLIDRQLSDTIATVSDVLLRYHPRTITDTIATLSDSITTRHQIRGLADTLVVMSDSLSHLIPVELTDTLVVMSDAMVSNDNYFNRTPLWGTAGTVFGSTIGATLEPGEFRPGDWVGYQHTVWFEWTCPASGKYRFRVRPYYPETGPAPVSDAWMAIYEFDPGAVLPSLDQLVYWNDFGSWYDEEAFDDVMVNFVATAGQKYVVQVGARQLSGIVTYWYPFDLEWQPITNDPVADDFPGQVLSNGAAVNGNPEWATAEPGDPWYWIRDLPWPFNNNGEWAEWQGGPSNRTMIYKFTPDQSGTATVSFYEISDPGLETGELAFWLFDGDGVTDVTDLVQAKAILWADIVYSGDFTFTAVAGRDYYLWISPDDGSSGPENRHRIRVRWPGGTAPPNDEVLDAVDLDDGLWHLGQTTEGATWEHLANQGFTLDNNPPLTPEPATVWYRASFDVLEDMDGVVIAFKELSTDLLLEWYMPVRVDETIEALADTIVTMSDSVAVTPLEHFGLADTIATFSDTVVGSKFAARSMADTLATVVDVGIGGAGGGLLDVLVTMSDTVSKAVARRMSDFAGNQFGSGVAGSHGLQRGAIFRGRSLADTAATVSDSVDLLNRKHFELADTLATMSDTVARNPATRPRTTEDTLATMSDQLTRVPPRAVVDTLVTLGDSLARPSVGRRINDALVTGSMFSTIATNRPNIPDTLVFWWASADFFTLKRRIVSRTATDTATTMSDGVSV